MTFNHNRLTFNPNRAAARVVQGVLGAVFLAWSVPAPAQPSADPAIETAQEFLKNAEYDQAITLLKESISETRDQLRGMNVRLRNLYLLLIKAYVVRSNASRFEPQGLVTSKLYLDAARSTTLECLQVPDLRNTRPDPEGDYPPEMFTLFNEVVAEIFGSLRVTELRPVEATVLLDGDTLSVMPDGLIGADNIPVGDQHLLVIRAEGYQPWTEDLTIYPNATLQRPYSLKKDKGVLWYAARGAVVAAGVAAVVIGTRGGGDNPPEPLPGPPDPPTKPRP